MHIYIYLLLYICICVCVHHTTPQIRVSLHSKDMGWAESTSPSEFLCTSFIPSGFRGHRGSHALNHHALAHQFTLFLLRFHFVRWPVWHCVPDLTVYFWQMAFKIQTWGGEGNTKRPIQHCYCFLLLFFVHGGVIQCYLKAGRCLYLLAFLVLNVCRFYFISTFRPKQLTTFFFFVMRAYLSNSECFLFYLNHVVCWKHDQNHRVVNGRGGGGLNSSDLP